MGTLLNLGWFILTCHYCIISCSQHALRIVFMYNNVNGQPRKDSVTEVVSQEVASSWIGIENSPPVAIVSRLSSDRYCFLSPKLGNVQIYRNKGLYITAPSMNACSNQDINSSVLISDSPLRSDSHLLSQYGASNILKFAECCQGNITSVSLIATPTDDMVSSNDVILFASANNGQSPFASSNNTLTFLSKNSIFFVAISFIVLMIISLGWLAFYYVERFRNAHTKEYISKRIAKAAKKALSKMPLKTIRGNGADDVNYQSEQCTVCIEQFRQNDTIRILPCKHLYHKVCIDPWLMENHTCPVCKLDILTASGIELPYGRYNCDLESTMAVRSLELYPVQLDLLMHANDSSSPDSSASGGGDQEIQLVHIRPPAVQVHSHANYFRNSSHSRRSSASSSSRLHVTPYGKVDEHESEHSPNNIESENEPSPTSLRSSSPSDEMSALLSSNVPASNNNNCQNVNKDVGVDPTRPATSSSKSKSGSVHSQNSGESNGVTISSSPSSTSKRSRRNHNCKNVACVVDVIAPATPPLDSSFSSSTANKPSSVESDPVSSAKKDAKEAV